MKSRLTSIFHQIRKPRFLTVTLTSGLITGYLFSKYKSTVHAESKTTVIIGERKSSLPIYSMTEVAKHTTKENGMFGNQMIYLYIYFLRLLACL
jgi:hypothetical protein